MMTATEDCSPCLPLHHLQMQVAGHDKQRRQQQQLLLQVQDQLRSDGGGHGRQKLRRRQRSTSSSAAAAAAWWLTIALVLYTTQASNNSGSNFIPSYNNNSTANNNNQIDNSNKLEPTADHQSCIDDESCRVRFGLRSFCDQRTNFCTLPYERGCLREEDRIGGKLRVCNSDDPPDAQQQGLCRTPNIDHPEIRIFSYDWDSSLFQAWVLQIIFSELLDVPTSVETGRLDVLWNFYRGDESIRTVPELHYSATVSLGSTRAFENAFKYQDCRLSSKRPEKYESCAHVAPEIWWDFAVYGDNKELLWDLGRQDVIESPSTIGALGRTALFIPKFTAENDPSLLSYFGYIGEENRRKLADTFLRPTSWSDYCRVVSNTNCTEPDNVAQRPPTTTDEDEMFFREGLYTGHFRKTAKNDCDTYPTSCTGHYNDLPCGLYSPMVSQTHHLNISLEANAYGGGLGYSRTHLAEIWRAANATQSHVAMYWWRPELLYEEFAGSESAFTEVTFPEATQECIDARQGHARCSAWPDRRAGDPRAFCEQPPVQLSKIYLKDLSNLGPVDIPVPIQSPAKKTLQKYTMSDLRMAEILSYVSSHSGPREAVCEWVVDNLDMLKETLLPDAYPRVVQEEGVGPFMYVSGVIAGIAALLVTWTALAIRQRRTERVIRYAQVEILQLILAGCLMVTVGAILYAIPPSDGVCLARPWLTHVGYTLSLAPQIVKVAAINRLISAANRYQRTKIDTKSLFAAVAGLCSISIIYMVTWTALDRPHEVPEYTETTDLAQDGSTIVEVGYRCTSNSNFWEYIPILWNGLLLFCAVVLAFQSRKLRNPFNETQYLGSLIYANFAFLIIRGATFFMDPVVDATVVSQVRSVIISFDMITSIVIYFLPMIFSRTKQRPPRFGRSGSFDLDDPSSYMQSTHFGARNRVVRFLTSVSRVTYDEGEASQHALDGTENKRDTEEGNIQRISENFERDQEVSNEEPGEESCDDTIPTQEPDEKGKIQELEAKVATLTEEVNQLRKRAPHLTMESCSSSEKKSSKSSEATVNY